MASVMNIGMATIQSPMASPPCQQPKNNDNCTRYTVDIGSVVTTNKNDHFQAGLRHYCTLNHHGRRCASTMREGAYTHPAIVLEIFKRNGEDWATIMLMSGTHYGRDIVPVYRRGLDSPLPLDAVVVVEPRSTLKKESFAQLDHAFEVPFSFIRPLKMEAFRNRIDRQCYDVLTSILGIERQHWTETIDLQRRLAASRRRSHSAPGSHPAQRQWDNRNRSKSCPNSKPASRQQPAAQPKPVSQPEPATQSKPISQPQPAAQKIKSVVLPPSPPLTPKSPSNQFSYASITAASKDIPAPTTANTKRKLASGQFRSQAKRQQIGCAA